MYDAVVVVEVAETVYYYILRYLFEYQAADFRHLASLLVYCRDIDHLKIIYHKFNIFKSSRCNSFRESERVKELCILFTQNVFY